MGIMAVLIAVCSKDPWRVMLSLKEAVQKIAAEPGTVRQGILTPEFLLRLQHVRDVDRR